MECAMLRRAVGVRGGGLQLSRSATRAAWQLLWEQCAMIGSGRG